MKTFEEWFISVAAHSQIPAKAVAHWAFDYAREEGIQEGAAIKLKYEGDKFLPERIEETIAQEADRLVNGPKREEYGDPIKSLVSIASRWSVILGVNVTPEKFCELMIELKMNRECAKAKRDNRTDAIGYIILWDKYVEWRERGEK